METTKGFVVHCRTGCTCCQSENHYRGPFKTRAFAKTRANGYHRDRVLASQFARNGRYSIQEVDIETLEGGRIIVDGRFVLDGFAEDTGEEIFYDYN